jgi:methionyl-tRNA formyltransferase
MNPPRIAYMGTPDFAVPPLERMVADGQQIVAVVTQPDRPRGRGKQMTASPVKRAALARSLPVLQPASLGRPEAVAQLAATRPDLLVVAAYGQILPPAVLDLPRLGAFNIHASLLPKYRGAAPIQQAILNMETETGVTIMRMDEGLDTGDILMRATVPIGTRDTAATLHDRLAAKGAALLAETLAALRDGRLQATPQDHQAATYAPRLNKKDGRIAWDHSAARLDAFIRAMRPWPGAFTFHDQTRYVIHAARPATGIPDMAPGTVLPGFYNELRVATGDGALSIEEIQAASGRRMDIETFLRGHDLAAGVVFT